MNTIKTQVYKSEPPRFNMVGQKLDTIIQLVQGDISPGLVKRLMNYAQKVVDQAGFEKFTENSTISVYNIDKHNIYCVRWTNEKGGFIELSGIHTHKGWPTLDYGFSIGVE